MHLITDDDAIIPVAYDQGSDLWVVKLRDFCEEDDYITLSVDGEDFEIHDWGVESTTRRVAFIWIELNEDDFELDSEEEGSDSDETGEDDSSASDSDDDSSEELEPGDDGYDYDGLLASFADR